MAQVLRQSNSDVEDVTLSKLVTYCCVVVTCHTDVKKDLASQYVIKKQTIPLKNNVVTFILLVN